MPRVQLSADPADRRMSERGKRPAVPPNPFGCSTRRRLCPKPRSPRFFLSGTGTRLDRHLISTTLRTITTTLGLRTETVHPRAHDLRHSFAVRTLIDWQRSGVQLDERIAALSTYLGHLSPRGELLVSDRNPGADGSSRRPPRPAVRSTAMTALAPSMQAYFTDRLIAHRSASHPTIAAYRHTFQLLLRFTAQRTEESPAVSISPISTRR